MKFKNTIIAYQLSILLLLPLSGFADSNSLFGDRNPDAPEGVEQFGQLAGTWKCTSASLQPDGSFQEASFHPTWVWHYALNGMAIQDVWIPDTENSPPGAVMGTNLRVYKPEDDSWEMVWTTEALGGFQTFSSRMQEGEMVMHGDIPTGRFPAHMARITFHNISERHFDWKYEASAPGDGQNWQQQSTLACDREV